MKDHRFRHGLTSKAEPDCPLLCSRSYAPSNTAKSKIDKHFYKEPDGDSFQLHGLCSLGHIYLLNCESCQRHVSEWLVSNKTL